MNEQGSGHGLEVQIERWRAYLKRRQAIHSVDIEELEDHLREQVRGLMEGGLSEDEAFLVAVKRMGAQDALSREFAREHADRLWKQLVTAPTDVEPSDDIAHREAMVVFCLAVAAALAIKLPVLFGIRWGEEATEPEALFYARNLSFFVLPVLTSYFAWKRRLDAGTLSWLAAAFVAAAVFANIYPLEFGSDTEVLIVLHLPIALWYVVGVAYASGRWNEVAGRMDFIRFSGELFIYYVLIALGGGVLTAFMFLMFGTIGIDVEPFFQSWVLPCGAMGAVLIASWLVEAKQSVIENMAPVLARLFTPFFVLVLLTFLATMLFTGRGIAFEREVLIAFDLLLVVVVGLLLYSISARDAHAPPDIFDVLRVVLVISALLADAVALWAIAARITELGFTPNRVAALGENAILLVNLTWSAVLYVRFVQGRREFAALEHWQTSYLPVYAVWAALVVVVFPPWFGYI